MHAREGVMNSTVYGDKLKRLYPVVEEKMSDSGQFDNVLEFLIMAGGRTLPEVQFQLTYRQATYQLIPSFSFQNSAKEN